MSDLRRPYRRILARVLSAALLLQGAPLAAAGLASAPRGIPRSGAISAIGAAAAGAAMSGIRAVPGGAFLSSVLPSATILAPRASVGVSATSRRPAAGFASGYAFELPAQEALRGASRYSPDDSPKDSLSPRMGEHQGRPSPHPSPASRERGDKNKNKNDEDLARGARLEKEIWSHAAARGFVRRGAPVEELPAGAEGRARSGLARPALKARPGSGGEAPEFSGRTGEPASEGPKVATAAELSRRRPLADIIAAIKQISLHVHWERWLSDIDDYLEDNADNVLLAMDGSGRIIGYLVLAEQYVNDLTDEVVPMPGENYLAYMATRQDTTVRGVGKALFLDAARRVRASGNGEMILHVQKGSPAVGFYEAMSRRLPILSQVEDGTYVKGEIWLRTVFDVRDAR